MVMFCLSSCYPDLSIGGKSYQQSGRMWEKVENNFYF